jgi:hypothetical protein
MHRLVNVTPVYVGKTSLIERAEGTAGKSVARIEGARYIRGQVLQPLIEANTSNPRDATLPLLQTPWLIALAQHAGDGDSGRQAIRTAELARTLDSENAATWLALFEAHRHLASMTEHNHSEHFAAMSELVPEILRRAPELKARLQLQFAAAYATLGRTGDAATYADAARKLHDAPTSARHRLTEAECQLLRGLPTTQRP